MSFQWWPCYQMVHKQTRKSSVTVRVSNSTSKVHSMKKEARLCHSLSRAKAKQHIFIWKVEANWIIKQNPTTMALLKKRKQKKKTLIIRYLCFLPLQSSLFFTSSTSMDLTVRVRNKLGTCKHGDQATSLQREGTRDHSLPHCCSQHSQTQCRVQMDLGQWIPLDRRLTALLPEIMLRDKHYGLCSETHCSVSYSTQYVEAVNGAVCLFPQWGHLKIQQ